MNRPMVTIFDVERQEEIIREMNDAEYAQHLIDLAYSEQHAAKQAEETATLEAKKIAKAELLSSLNLSQETLDLLNGLN